MRLSVDERRERVLALVRERGSLRIAELAEELGVSTVTARRDVETLAQAGRLRRLHGAVLPQDDHPAPASAGRSTPDGGSGLVLGIIVPGTRLYSPELVRGAQDAAAERGARLILGISHYLPDEDCAQVARMLSDGIDGLLIVPSWGRGVPTPEQVEWLLTLEVPTVVVERRIPRGPLLERFDEVRSDHLRGTASAVDHLWGLGHRKIALLARESVTSPQVHEGFAAALEELGAESPLAPIAMDPPGEPKGLDVAVEELSAALVKGQVTAAVVHNDEDAIGVVQRLQSRGVRIPQDIALVSYEADLVSLAGVALSAVEPPRREVGAAAVRLLVERITRPASPDAPPSARQHVTLLPTLTVRESSGA
ncbi:hypothetical protein BIV57_01245 [Mangrovactinospora gilvigrisea]|uniref:HTH deoR-type domain-containing protein n=1 Tax=Mangrovactinospora gilvigrisea TaxID=1428644 RepID=A0A1J7BLF8_9ACTN|nr:substrate-binding domain-containing protein [Mangrovactinospora gilvigrisea]OIV39486.1 hypothetical protein BIV57_01245 [Mangrovactinospora gilvigrisea]